MKKIILGIAFIFCLVSFDLQVAHAQTVIETVRYPSQTYEVLSSGSLSTSTVTIMVGGIPVATVARSFSTAGTSTALVQTSKTTNFIHNDHLGSTDVVTDSKGIPVQYLDYDPYGKKTLGVGAGGNNREYIGETFDDNTGLNYLNARYYASARGNFLSQDPVALFSPTQLLSDPQQLNLYNYARGNPIVNKDPAGQKVEAYAKATDRDSRGTHVFLYLDPDNPEDFGNRSAWTLGAYVDLNKGSLIKKVNADSDIYVVETEDLLKGKQTVTAPAENTDTQFINKIMDSFNNYKEDAAYDPFTLHGYNSNNFTTKLLFDAGVKKLPWNGNAPGIDPGYGEAIPTSYLRANGDSHVPSSNTQAFKAIGSYAVKVGYNTVSGKINNIINHVKDSVTSILGKITSH